MCWEECCRGSHSWQTWLIAGQDEIELDLYNSYASFYWRLHLLPQMLIQKSGNRGIHHQAVCAFYNAVSFVFEA